MQDIDKTLKDALQHQNILGWENFLRGFTSVYWLRAQLHDRTVDNKNKRRSPWNLCLVRGILNVHEQIWEDRNTQIHGRTIKERNEKLR
jgi:hypothetical protein